MYQSLRMPRARRRDRRGATLVEGAIVINTCLILVLGMLEMGIAVMQHNELSEGARRVARQAIVRGSQCSSATMWGPSSYSGTAADGTEAALILREILVGTEPSEVEVAIEWPDGANDVGDRVRVRLRYNHTPIIPFVDFTDGIELKASAAMRIAH